MATNRRKAPTGGKTAPATRAATQGTRTASRRRSRAKAAEDRKPMGGARPGAGRKALPPDQKLVNFTIRIPADWKDQITERKMAQKVRDAMAPLFE